MFCVGIFVVHGFDHWQCGKFLHIVRQKNLAPYMQRTDTGDWSCTPYPHFLSLTPNPIAAHPRLFVCSISFNTFSAAVHAGGCIISLNLRMTH